MEMPIEHPLWDEFSEKWEPFRVRFDISEEAKPFVFWGYVEGYVEGNAKAVQTVAEMTTRRRPELVPNQN